MEGDGYHYARTDWWNHILTIPAPRVVVLEDLDDPPGLGAFIGEVNANIFLALGCVGLVTNGAVRDLNEVRSAGFPCSPATFRSPTPTPTSSISAGRSWSAAWRFGPAI